MNTLVGHSVRFLAVGSFNVLFTLAVFWVLDRFLSSTIGVQGAYWIAALLGIVNGFVWQRLLVWRSKSRWHAEFVRFLVFNLAASVVNSLLLLIAVEVLHLPAFPSQVVFTAVFVVISFLGNRGWVFRARTASVSAPERTRIDVFLQYYKPHVSGLTNMAADLAESAVRRGYEVHVHCVATSGAPGEFELGGVKVHAYRKSFALGRAAFSFAGLAAIWRLRRRGGIAHVHLPYPEAVLLGWTLGTGWRVVGTYHCDAPRTGGFGTVVARALDMSHRAFTRRADITVTSSEDYAQHSRLKDLFARVAAVAIPATSVDRAGGSPRFAREGVRQVGFLGRPTSEKGIDVLLRAIELLPADVCLLIGGPVEGLSEKASFDSAKLAALTAGGRVRTLGFIAEEELADFYASIDVLALPSTNSFEAFGIVQVEAMSAGVPVVASNLPGVRTIVWRTGFGRIAAVNDAQDLAVSIAAVLQTTYDAPAVRRILEDDYLSPVPENAYLELYQRLSARQR